MRVIEGEGERGFVVTAEGTELLPLTALDESSTLAKNEKVVCRHIRV